MEDQDGAPRLRSTSRPRWRRRHAGLLLLPLTAVLVWVERRPIVTHFIDREFAARNVPARYTVTDLGLGRQRLTGVTIGDPARPDLVADWIETRVAFGSSGPYLASLAAGRVAVKARLADGRLSLGMLDRLMPPSSGKPFALPDLPVTIREARIALATPAGAVAIRLAGAGNLRDGFRGTLAAAAPRLTAGGCVARAMRASVRLAIDDAAPGIAGPVRLGAVRCANGSARDLQADVRMTLGPALDRWRGDVRLATGRIAAPGIALAALGGTIGFAGTRSDPLHGILDLAATGAAARGVDARRIGARGEYRWRPDGARFAGRIAATDAQAAVTLPDPVALAATPLGPIARQATRALAQAARRFDLDAGLGIMTRGRLGIAVDDATIRAASGAHATLTSTQSVIWWPGTGTIRLTGTLAVRGGGLPDLRATLRHEPLSPVSGELVMAPYRVAGASLALTRTSFAFQPGGAGRIDGIATLSGPLGDGRVEALRAPLAVRWTAGTLTLNPDCTPVAARELRIAGLALDRPQITLCPTGTALIRVAAGRVTGGARLPELRLRGTLGSSPLAIDGEGARLDLAGRSFAVEGLRTRLGPPERETRLNAASLDGRLEHGGVAGRFAGGAGRIAAVPLNLGELTGDWRLAGGVLDIGGALVVTDSADTPRFRPMRGRDVRLRLAGGAISARGALDEPTTGTAVADVRIGHDLSAGTGSANLTVPGLTFGDGFQPDLLTPLTFGVIADVKGRIDGAGHIAWSPAGVVSTGEFATGGTDLAAAFGPVTGIAGRIRFDDLLGLHTPPGQVATVKSVNPGIAVENGTVRYQLLGGTRVQVEGAEWPFAGGALMLDPSLLVFDATQARRLTFRVAGARADQFLQQFEFDNLNATGVFDGVLPMIFDDSGGRIEAGRLTMREGGGTIAYVGALGQEQLGFWGDLAFQALRSLRYRTLALTMNGPLAGEMVTDVRFAGVSQGQGAKSNFLIRRLQRLPFIFNVRIRAPFRGLIDSAASFYDPRRLIQRNLPALIEEQRRREGAPATSSIQPEASETVR